jgi:exonuclease VII small subunit
MKVKFINTLESARNYVKEVENGDTNFEESWNEYLIKPY